MKMGDIEMKLSLLLGTAVLATGMIATGAMAQNGVGGNNAGVGINAGAANGGANGAVGGNNNGANGAVGARNGANNGNNGRTANNNGAMPSQRRTNEASAGGGAILTISPSGVRQVQQALNRLGYEAGPVNGVWDRATARAMVSFQEAHGLEPTGNLNISSIAAMHLTKDLITNPIAGNNEGRAATGAPPPRGANANVGGSPLPSQRITNETPGGRNTNSGAR